MAGFFAVKKGVAFEGRKRSTTHACKGEFKFEFVRGRIGFLRRQTDFEKQTKKAKKGGKIILLALAFDLS
jgi:hypothetical protein